MLTFLKRLFGFKKDNVSLSDKLFANILVPKSSHDHRRWPELKG